MPATKSGWAFLFWGSCSYRFAAGRIRAVCGPAAGFIWVLVSASFLKESFEKLLKEGSPVVIEYERLER